jgi:hypothetical protein
MMALVGINMALQYDRSRLRRQPLPFWRQSCRLCARD